MIHGRLYELPSGIPVLEVPGADVLAHGTAILLADAAIQARLAAEFAARDTHPDPRETNPQGRGFGRAGGTPEGREPWTASVNSAPGGHSGFLYGEFLTFNDPKTRLPAIDRLEGPLPVDMTASRALEILGRMKITKTRLKDKEYLIRTDSTPEINQIFEALHYQMPSRVQALSPN